MALIKADRVRETTTTTGTGAISLAGASTGYVAFSTVCADGDTCYYVIVSQTGTEWETGLGTFSTPATFTRTTVHSSSNSGSAVSFTAGTKDIFIALTATQFSSIGTVTSVGGTGTVNGITLTGNVTSSGNLTLGGALTGVNLGSQVTGTLAVTNGGTGTATGSITGTGALTFASGPHSGTNGRDISLVVSAGASGYYRGSSLIDGIYIGRGRLSSLSTNVLIGAQGNSNEIGVANTLVGNSAAGAVTTSYNTIIGFGAGGSANGGTNTIIGSFANNYNVYGSRVISIGSDSANYQADGTTQLQTASNSIYIGYDCRGYNNSDSNSIVIGYQAIGEGANTTVIGNTSTTYTKLHGYTKSKSLQETVFAITDGSSVDINPANGGIQTWTLGANRTPTASSFAEGQSVTLMIDDGTAYAITWSSVSPTWIGGSAPTLATSGYTVIELWKRSTVIYGALVGTA